MLKRLVLSPPERQRLRERVRSRISRAEEVQRAKIILLLASGQSQWAVSRKLGCSINTVQLWLKRFREDRLPGLFSRHRGRIAVFCADEKSAIQGLDRSDRFRHCRLAGPNDMVLSIIVMGGAMQKL